MATKKRKTKCQRLLARERTALARLPGVEAEVKRRGCLSLWGARHSIFGCGALLDELWGLKGSIEKSQEMRRVLRCGSARMEDQPLEARERRVDARMRAFRRSDERRGLGDGCTCRFGRTLGGRRRKRR